jgi:hypothetical protein
MLVKITETVYWGSKEVIGKVVSATAKKDGGFFISTEELVRVGAREGCFSKGRSYYFLESKVEIV